MGFWLKKTIASLLMPLPLLLLLFVVALYFFYKKRYSTAKKLFILSFVFITLISYEPFVNFYLYPLEKSVYKLEKIPQNVEYIFILGNGHKEDARYPHSAMLNDAAIKRLTQGFVHYRQSGAQLIVSGYGGKFNTQSHADVAAAFLMQLGVKKEDIIKFETTKDTFAEAKEYKKRFGKSKCILVTSASHMQRAQAIFKRLQLEPHLAPTDFLSQPKIDWLGFSGQNIYKIEVATHEYLGLLWYKLRGYI
ncbi:MAG: YdcF family protein [Campylobacterota bacterium]